MAPAAQNCGRILTALEDLVAQETAALHARDFAGLNALAERARPLVDFLVTRAPALEAGGLRDRFAAIRSERQRSLETLAAALAAAREQQREADLTGRRVAQIAPAYGGTPARVSRQLRGVG